MCFQKHRPGDVVLPRSWRPALIKHWHRQLGLQRQQGRPQAYLLPPQPATQLYPNLNPAGTPQGYVMMEKQYPVMHHPEGTAQDNEALQPIAGDHKDHPSVYPVLENPMTSDRL